MSSSVIAGALGKAVAPIAVGALRAFGKAKYDALIATYTNILDSFIANSLHRCGKVKTLVNGEEPINLIDIYVETRFENKNGKFSDTTLLKKFESETGAYCLSGFAGSGKSMFMKYAAFSLIERMLHHQRIPLFIEVRDLNHFEDASDLERMMFDYCSSSENKANFEQFVIGLREGLFIIMLDGVDEVPIDRLDKFLKKLKSFHDKFRQCVIVASVRPGTQLANITNFRTYKVSAMALDQVLSVVNKAPLDKQRKDIFVNALQSGLYSSHKSFLSNPLLVTIVLITFEDASRVPEHLTGFYGAAFDALFGRHDWSKGVYVREHRSKLEKPEFERVFMHFCYVGYFQSSYIFEKDRVITLINAALQHAKVEVSASDYLHDCVLAVCLLQIDEPKVIFVHRSFQEYFTAKFVSQYSGSKLPTMLNWLARRSHTDSTFEMVAQLNKESVIRAWGLTAIRSFERAWSQHIANNNYTAIFNEAGINGLLANLDDGSIIGIGIDHERGFAVLDSLLMLASEDMAAHHTMLRVSLYPSGKIGDLPTNIRNVLTKQTDQTGTFMIGFSDKFTSLLEGLDIAAAAKNLINQVRSASDAMERYLRERGEFVSIVDLVSPDEAGKVNMTKTY